MCQTGMTDALRNNVFYFATVGDRGELRGLFIVVFCFKTSDSVHTQASHHAPQGGAVDTE